MKDILKEYTAKKAEIKKRLKEFSKSSGLDDKGLFQELAFCILTPGTKAQKGDEAVKELAKTGLLFEGSQHQISAKLRGIVRFHNNKAGYLVLARKFFTNGKGLDIKSRLNKSGGITTRNWFAENVKGIGYKEASHFLRNIGLGKDLAILDRHILKNLKKEKVIDKVPASISRKSYLDIEERMRRFSKKVGIPLDELDLLFWSHQTTFIFK
jgi:N-glycosylase/DNA lyase